MNTLKDTINQIISEYHVEKHVQIKAKVENLMKKYSEDVKLFEVLAIVFAQNSKIDDAIVIFAKILNKEPKSIDTLMNISLAYFEKNKTDKALEYLEKAKVLKVKQTEIYFNIGLIYEKKQNWNKAISNYEKAIKYNSKNINALINLGNIFLLNKSYNKSLKFFESAIKLRENDPALHHNIAVVLTQLNQSDKAIKCYLKSIQLNSTNSLTYYNLGNLLANKLLLNEAIDYYFKAININPNNVKFYYNLAHSQSEKGDYYSAIKNYEKAISIDENFINAKYNLARLHLATENFKSGWSFFEERHNQGNPDQRIQKILKLKKWNGKKTSGTVYVHGEQGVGDLILHASIIFDLYKVHEKICLIVDSRLKDLFKRSFNKIKVLSYQNKITFNDNDLHITLASLGSFFRKSINDFPRYKKGYIIPNLNKTEYFKKFFKKNRNIKIGFSWRSVGDRGSLRTISLEKLSKILKTEKIDFVNLQYGESKSEINNFQKKYKKKLINFSNIDLKNDFESLSAIIKSCDLVITISNAVAHLSAAIGKETWIIVPVNTQWHWFYNRKDSLWYPKVKLFRQNKFNDWNDTIEKVYLEIKKIT